MDRGYWYGGFSYRIAVLAGGYGGNYFYFMRNRFIHCETILGFENSKSSGTPGTLGQVEKESSVDTMSCRNDLPATGLSRNNSFLH